MLWPQRPTRRLHAADESQAPHRLLRVGGLLSRRANLRRAALVQPQPRVPPLHAAEAAEAAEAAGLQLAAADWVRALVARTTTRASS